MTAPKNQSNAQKSPKELYLKIPYHILNLRDLGLCEKVLLAHIYSFGSKGCWQSNATLAEFFLTSPRTIRRWLAKIIAAKLVHVKSPKGYHRTIWARSHPDVREATELYYRGKHISKANDPPAPKTPPGVDSPGLQPGQIWPSESDKDGFRHGQNCPTTNNTTIKETIAETTAPPSPLPAGGQAPAVLVERKKADLMRIEQFKKNFGIIRETHQPLSEEVFQERKQQQILALLKT